jgi:hypothetical protein
MTLKDKIELYENFLKKIASHDVEKEMNEALEHPNNGGSKPGEPFVSRFPFAFGMISQSLKNAVSDAQYALDQGKK